MNYMLRWLLFLPTIALSAAAPWMLYPLGRGLVLLACPKSLRGTESTTDFSQPDYSVSVPTCSADWFPAVDASLMIIAILMSIVFAGITGHRLPPSHRRLASAMSSISASGIMIAAFAQGL